LSLILPTGSVTRGLGDGSLGVQVNVPLSWRVSQDVVTHWNAGGTILPRAQAVAPGGGRFRRTLTNVDLGASVVGPVRWPVQFMAENLVLFGSEIGPTGGVDRSTAWTFSPGIRAAINVGSLQIVPGLAIPFTRSGGRTDRDTLLYLSFEHPFRAL